MRLATLICALLLALASTGSEVAAQERAAVGLADLVPGSRVRVVAAGEQTIGGVRSVSPDSLVLTLWQQPGSLSLATRDIRRLELSRGRESRWSSALRWGWRSALVWGAFGALFASGPCPDPEDIDLTCEQFRQAVFGQTLFTGALLGVAYGSFAPRERWVRVGN